MSRFSQLRQLGYNSYAEYLRSSHWHRTKQRYRESDRPQACICGETEVDLHHTTYENLGNENLEDLTALCRRCHTLVHVLERRGELTLDLEGFESDERAAAYAIEQDARKAKAQADREGRLNEWHVARADFERWLVTHFHRQTNGNLKPISTDIRAIVRRLDAIERKIRDAQDPTPHVAEFRKFHRQLAQDRKAA